MPAVEPIASWLMLHKKHSASEIKGSVLSILECDNLNFSVCWHQEMAMVANGFPWDSRHNVSGYYPATAQDIARACRRSLTKLVRHKELLAHVMDR